jgi:tetrahydromethanopterin S-methyltransferase subunit E
MKKGGALVVGLLFALSVAYDFWRGYHETRSIVDGIAFVVFGLGVLAVFWWLYSRRSSD